MSDVAFDRLLARSAPLLALAPMQDVTTRVFWELMARYGGADVYFTEYFRVHADSRLDRGILSSITQNPTGRPVVAQMIGNDIPSLVRTARELRQHPVAAIDLNLGCPAPIVYRKCAGGGLLRDLPLVDSILGALRDAIPGRFTVKTRIGFDDERTFDQLLPIFARHGLDLLTVHGRTVKQMYREGVRYDLIGRAAKELACPVLANGDVSSAGMAGEILEKTGARGLMIGRGAIRNPWIFGQIRARQTGAPHFVPRGRDVLRYIEALHGAVPDADAPEICRINRLKKYLNFIGEGIGPSGGFLHAMRRAGTEDGFFGICREYLDHDEPMPLEPHRDETARARAA